MATINGTSGNDSLVGTAGIDTINGLDGDDTLVGGGGYDFFSGGLGNDSIVAGVNGGDWAFYDSNIGGINANLATGLVTGALGNDTLIGIDDLSGTNFADSITGSSGNNSIQGRGGDDTLIGGGGIDTADYNNATGPVTVSLTTNLASGADGNDSLSGFTNIWGSPFDDSLTGDAFTNTLNGNNGNDTLTGLDGTDLLFGGTGNDSISGGNGNDVISGDTGLDTLDGGVGSGDTVQFETVPNGINLNLATGIASNNGEGQVESVTNFENAHGSYFNDVIQLSDSSGYVFARKGNDSVTGGMGDDNLIGGSGNDTLNGGAGFDNADYGALTFDGGIDGFQGVTVNLLAGTATDNWGNNDTLISIENLSGSVFNDSFTGDNAANFLNGQGGNDTIVGGLGNDYMIGGSGDDTYIINITMVNGVVTAAEGFDTLVNNDGTGAGFDVLNLNGLSNNNGDFQRNGNDLQVNFQASNQWSNEGPTVGGVGGITLQDFFTANPGNRIDRIQFSNGYLNVTQVGTYLRVDEFDLANVQQYGNYASIAGNDTMIGSARDESFLPGDGNDSVDGGLGYDNVRYRWGSVANGITVNMALASGQVTNDGNGGVDTLVSIERIDGTALNDTMTGGAAQMDLFGGAGNDSLTGGSAQTQLQGGSGNDTLTGGSGFAYAVFWDAQEGVTASLLTNSSFAASLGADIFVGIDGLNGGDYNDNLTGDNFGNNWIYGGGGNDSIFGLDGNDSLYGGDGNDSLDGGNGGDSLFGEAGNDTLNGGIGVFNDTLDGGIGNDSLMGLDGNDTLKGGDGNDSLYGGNNDDSLVGGLGNEAVMDGGAGYDTLAYGDYLTFVAGGGYIFNYSFQGANGYSNVTVQSRGNNPATFEQDFGVIAVEQLTATGGDDVMRDLGDNREFNFIAGRGNDVVVGSPFDGYIDSSQYFDLAPGFHLEVDLDPLQFGKYNVGGFYGNVAVVNSSNLSIANGGTVVEVDFLQSIQALLASAGNDLILGSNKNGFEFLQGRGGNDTIDGRGGVDIVDYNPANQGRGVNITLAAVGLDTIVTDDGTQVASLIGAQGTDTLRNIEYVWGTQYNDTLTGNEADNSLRGRGGNDTLDGGTGFDMANYRSAGSALTITLLDGVTTGVLDGQGGTDQLSNIEGLRGGTFNDALTGNSVANKLEGDDGDDTLTGGGGNDTLDGQGGFDYAFYNNLADSQGYNLVFNKNTSLMQVTGKGSNSGYAETDTLYSIDAIGGTAFGDTITDSTAGRNMYLGGYLGNDTITGNAADYDFAIYSERDLNVNVNANLGTGVVTVTNDTDGGYLETDTLVGIRGVWGGAGSDSLTGGAADEFFRGNGGNDTIDGGGGMDIADFRASSTAVNIVLAANGSATVAETINAIASTDTLLNIEGLSGSGNNDTLAGNSSDNWLRGRAGNDSIDGGGGTDTLSHTTAFNAIFVDLSGSVNNVQDGEGGTDSVVNVENVIGGDYNDAIKGSVGANSLEGGAGSDTLMGREGNDTLMGGSGFDAVDYSYLNDANGYNFVVGPTTITVTGIGANSAYLETDTVDSIDIVTGTGFNDSLSDSAAGHQSYFQGLLGNDTLRGNAQETDFAVYYERGSNYAINANLATGIATITDSNNFSLIETDTLIDINGFLGSQGGGNDTITGNSLNNWLRGGGGNDTIDGGAGFDVASYSNSLQGIAVQMAEANLSFNVWDGINGLDTLSNIEGIGGTNYDDSLQGNSSDNYFRGENGYDYIDGGAGMDWAEYSSSEKAVNITLAETGQTLVADDGYGAADILVNIEGLYGSSYDDVLTGNSQANVFRGNEGNDTLDGLGGNDLVRYTTSHSGITITLAAAGIDTIVSNDGYGGVDTLRNIENIQGSNFNDNFSGNALANELLGRMGNDTLRGNGGNDSLDGESGIDRAVFTGNKADYTITFDSITGSYSVADSVGARDGTDTLKSIEVLQFADVTTALGSISVDPRGTYLSAAPTDLVNSPTTVLLSDLGLAPGDMITLTRNGDYQPGIAFTDTSSNMLAVFTGGSGFIAPDTYLGFTSPVQGIAPNLPTDVGQDFFVQSGVTTVKIPVGATTLQFSASDSYFQDNTDPDGDYGVTIRKLDGSTSFAGIDLVFGTTGNDTLSGGNGDDSLFGGDGNDTINGDAGNDNLQGGNGDDSIFGGTGSDFLVGGAGNDTLDGGVVTDFINYIDLNSTSYGSATAAVTIDLTGITGNGSTGSGFATGDASVGTDVLRNITFLTGSNFNDTITGSAANLFEQIEGGAGNDSLNGGAVAGIATNRVSYQNTTGAGVVVDLIAGTAVGEAGSNAGNDTLANFVGVRGSNFADTILGTNRTDFTEFFEGRDGNDYIDGRGGNDQVRFDNASGGVTASLISNTSSGVAVGNDTFVNIEQLRGSAYNDIFIGNDLSNNLDGQGGDDSLLGNGGADTLTGLAGNDTMDGGLILDRINYNDNNFTGYTGASAGVNINLMGISGDGSVGSGTVTGDASVGTDTVRNIDFFQGSNFNDTITGSAALVFEQFEGMSGNDTIDGGAITDTLNGANNNRAAYHNASGAGVVVDFILNTAVGEAGSNIGTDTLININQVRGTNFADTLLGSNRTDVTESFEGRDGNDVIDGKGGFDLIRLDSASGAVVANLALGTSSGAGVGSDTFSNIEAVWGSNFNDSLTGGLAANGTSVGLGEAEYEVFLGVGGNDTIDGGQGYDRADYNRSTSAVTVILNDTLDGSATGDASVGTDVLRSIEGVRGSVFNDTLTGSNTAAFESFEGREGNDSINGQGGIDRADYYWTLSGVNVNLATGIASDGYGGTDTLSGIENVRGSRDFNDVLTGDAGNNRLQGLGGNDTINGGAGYDTAVFSGAKFGYTVTRGVGSVTVSGADGVDILTGIEKLQFADGATFLAGGGADFNGDGVGDVLWRNNTSGLDTIWRGANTATQQVVATVADTNWKILATSDFNADGVSDILWRNTATGANTIWLGGNTATQQAVATVADQNWKVVGVGDFNGDGSADILWRNSTSGLNTIWRGGNSATQQNVDTVADLNWKAAGVGDFNGDGTADILWRNSVSGLNTIWRGGNSATQQNVNTVADLNWKVTGIGDFNGDGTSDLLWRNSSSGLNTVWLGANSATQQNVAPVGDLNWKVLGTGDYNGDGTADLLWRNASTGANTIWQSANNATQQNAAVVGDLNWTIHAQTNTWSDAPTASPDRDADLNGDAKSDLLWRNTVTGANVVWSSANSATTQNVNPVGDLNWKLAGMADFDGNGKDDILWRNASNGANAIWGGGNSATPIATGAVGDLNWKVAGLGDFNGDGKDDILWRNTTSGANTIWQSANSATLQNVDTVGDLNWKATGIGDFNGDGKDDVLWRNFSTGANTVWLGANSATQQAATTVADLAWKIAGIADFNGDGKDDILWRNTSTGANTIWNAGNSATQLSINAVADLAWQIVGVGDYSGDGKADVAWRNTTTGANTVWNDANSATQLTLIGVADLNWTIQEQTNSWVNAAGVYAV